MDTLAVWGTADSKICVLWIGFQMFWTLESHLKNYTYEQNLHIISWVLWTASSQTLSLWLNNSCINVLWASFLYTTQLTWGSEVRWETGQCGSCRTNQDFSFTVTADILRLYDFFVESVFCIVGYQHTCPLHSLDASDYGPSLVRIFSRVAWYILGGKNLPQLQATELKSRY